MSIGARLKEIRNFLNISAKEMAENIGVGLRTYGGYERDEITLSQKLIMYLFKNYNLNIHWLFTGNGEMIQQPKNTLMLRKDPVKIQLTNVGKKINKIRITNDFISREMAMLIDMDEGRLADICTGRKEPTYDEILKICELFDVSADNLFFGKE